LGITHYIERRGGYDRLADHEKMGAEKIKYISEEKQAYCPAREVGAHRLSYAPIFHKDINACMSAT